MQENLTRREQNQRDTWNAIHLSAYQLVSELSLAAATVDDIASRAGISRRTFFNYFPTKEDAILGTRLPEVPHGTAERYAESGQDELTRVVHLFVAVLRTAVPEETSLRRRQMVGQHPGLRSRVMQLVTDVEHLVREVVESAAAQQHAQKPDDAAAALEVRLLLAGAITKHAFMRYQQAGSDDLDAFLDDSIAHFRKVVGETE